MTNVVKYYPENEDVLSGEIVPMPTPENGSQIDWYRDFDWLGEDPEKMAYAITKINKTKMGPAERQAWNALLYGILPKGVVQKRKGRSGKEFSYIPHTVATEMMNLTFGHLWEMEVLNSRVNPDRSANATVKVTIKIPAGRDPMTGEPKWYIRSVTEVGAYDPPVVKKDANNKPLKDETGSFVYAMDMGDTQLAAASRGFLRCLFRLFGLGIEFYEHSMPNAQAKEAGALIMKMAVGLGYTAAKARSIIKKELEITDAAEFLKPDVFAKVYDYLYQKKQEEFSFD